MLTEKKNDEEFEVVMTLDLGEPEAGGEGGGESRSWVFVRNDLLFLF
jgi:hypothetical protein